MLEIIQLGRKAVALSFDASNIKALDGFVESVKSTLKSNWGTDTFDYLINNAAIGNNPQSKTFLSSQTPLGRVGQADDIGSVVAFSCSDDAKWINGQHIEVSGGINL